MKLVPTLKMFWSLSSATLLEVPSAPTALTCTAGAMAQEHLQSNQLYGDADVGPHDVFGAHVALRQFSRLAHRCSALQWRCSVNGRGASGGFTIPAWIRNAIIFWDHNIYNMIQRSHWQLMLGPHHPPITFLAFLLRSREIGGSLSALLYNQSRHKAMNSRHIRFRRSQKSPKVRSWGTHIGSSNPFPR